MILELILFTFSALFGILMYWRESKNNKLYRTINRITHAENLQMKSTDRKGFLYQQPFLIRLVVIAALFTIVAALLKVLTPIPFRFELLASNIVGALVGTYFASLVVFTNDKIEGGQDSIDESIEKGKGFLNDLKDDVKEKAKDLKETIEDKFDRDNNVKETKTSKKETPKKSGRDRLKDKGLL
ncbi:MAG: hypothetical protein V3U80_07175 [Flavobacteriaceae bacterium]